MQRLAPGMPAKSRPYDLKPKRFPQVGHFQNTVTNAHAAAMRNTNHAYGQRAMAKQIEAAVEHQNDNHHAE